MRVARNNKNIAQIKAAKALGLSISSIKSKEVGTSALQDELLRKAAKLYDVSSAYLIGLTLDNRSIKKEPNYFKKENNAIGEIIRNKRIAKNFTIIGMASYLDISPVYLENHETGVRPLYSDLIIEISLALDVSTDYLLGLTTDEKPFYAHNRSLTALDYAFLYGTCDVDKVISLRTQLNFSKTEFAKKLNLSSSRYFYFESGQKPFQRQRLIELADALGVTVFDILIIPDEHKSLCQPLLTKQKYIDIFFSLIKTSDIDAVVNAMMYLVKEEYAKDPNYLLKLIDTASDNAILDASAILAKSIN